jgi:integrase
MGHSDLDPAVHERRPWNVGQNVGPKRPLRPRDIWAIRFYLDEHKRLRDRALFDLAIDSKLRGCDLVKLRIGDLVSGRAIRNRATVIQQKTGLPVQFEIMTEARKSLLAWLERRKGSLSDFVFPAGSITWAISAPANTPASSMSGSRPSGSTSGSTARILCVGPRRP